MPDMYLYTDNIYYLNQVVIQTKNELGLTDEWIVSVDEARPLTYVPSLAGCRQTYRAEVSFWAGGASKPISKQEFFKTREEAAKKACQFLEEHTFFYRLFPDGLIK